MRAVSKLLALGSGFYRLSVHAGHRPLGGHNTPVAFRGRYSGGHDVPLGKVGYRQTLSRNEPAGLAPPGDNSGCGRNLDRALARCVVVGGKVRYLARNVLGLLQSRLTSEYAP
jgi:hypothetical protein